MNEQVFRFLVIKALRILLRFVLWRMGHMADYRLGGEISVEIEAWQRTLSRHPMIDE
jgi:hypothetical protein